jgi:hypothetical protein
VSLRSIEVRQCVERIGKEDANAVLKRDPLLQSHAAPNGRAVALEGGRAS